MVERIKNKKGFTIIEVMVVIALIGILAAVLVPNFAGARDTAKNAGVMTNAKSVEAYVTSVIDSFAVSDFENLEDAIKNQFDNNPVTLTNPFTGGTSAIDVDSVDVGAIVTGGTPGVIYVRIDDDTLDVFISGIGADGNSIDATERVIER